MTTERILCIPKSAFDARNPFTGFAPIGMERLDLGEYLQGAPEKIAHFVAKDLAEQDESRLQIIPYITLMCNDALFTYRRGPSGGEERLHHQLSIGVGGHINDQDDPDEPFFAFLEGCKRELREEVGLDLPHDAFKERVVGLLYDDSNAVGRVHLGVSIIIALDEEMAKTALNRCEIGMHEPRFEPLKNFKQPELQVELETWSRFVVNHILGETGECPKANDWGFRERVGMLSICASNLASAASGYMLQTTNRGHLMSKQHVEEEMGKVQAMMAGLIYHKEAEEHKIKAAARAFRDDLPNILQHQA